MQHTDIVTIANAKTGFERIKAMNHKFMTHAKEYATPNDIPSSLQILEDAVAIDCFGHVATAKPRPIRALNGALNDIYFMEYVFNVPFGDKMIEVTRFYLSEYGQIKDAPSAQIPVCDYMNTQIARHLCGRALTGFLASPLLAPTEVQS